MVVCRGCLRISAVIRRESFEEHCTVTCPTSDLFGVAGHEHSPSVPEEVEMFCTRAEMLAEHLEDATTYSPRIGSSSFVKSGKKCFGRLIGQLECLLDSLGAVSNQRAGSELESAPTMSAQQLCDNARGHPVCSFEDTDFALVNTCVIVACISDPSLEDGEESLVENGAAELVGRVLQELVSLEVPSSFELESSEGRLGDVQSAQR